MKRESLLKVIAFILSPSSFILLKRRPVNYDVEPLRVITMRATIIINRDRTEEATTVASWFDRWGDQLTFVSENQGCGCCVDMWDIEGPPEAIAQLPEAVNAASDWAGYS
jgi:hypothetical protein